jgi:hypothetical protein
MMDDPRVAGSGRFDDCFVATVAGRLTDAYESGMAGVALGYEAALYNAEWATRAALWLGDPARVRVALELYEARPDRGRVVAATRQTLRAGLHALLGERDAAMAAYRDAIRRWREMDVPFMLGLCLLDFATLVGPREPEARAAADEARAIFTRLGSPPLLARLDAGLAKWETGAPAATAAGLPSPVEPRAVG